MALGLNRQGIVAITLGISIITVLMLISVNTFAQPLNLKPILTIKHKHVPNQLLQHNRRKETNAHSSRLPKQ